MNMNAQRQAASCRQPRGNNRGIRLELRTPLAPAGHVVDLDRLVGLACLLMLPLALWLA